MSVRPKAPTKAADWTVCREFRQIPNIGPAMCADFALLGLKAPLDLRGNDPFALYRRLCAISGQRHDPCVLDTLMAAVDFMNGAAPRPWWDYTAARKRQFPEI